LVVDTKKKKKLILGLVGGIILFIYGIISTLQPANFGRVYAAYGGIFIVFSILLRGVLIDKKKPDSYEIIGSFIILVGAVIIYYAPRNG
jgi:small multidrug resistance family-3 protein